MAKALFRFRFYRKAGDEDKWPMVKEGIEGFASILNEDEPLSIVVDNENNHEVAFHLFLEEKNFYHFYSLYDTFLRTHHLDI